jgi:hypothetical protein
MIGKTGVKLPQNRICNVMNAAIARPTTPEKR